ncbi:MAG TPA: hypothetical protein VJ184_08450, partial [Chryseolinea sp.]|nr:hypothetical protein [Chryseolinea sp.]
MRSLYLPFVLVLSFATQAQQKLLAPKEFLGYDLGDRFTPHYRVMDYFKHVAEVMSNVELKQYGETYEHRPLVYAIITSAENYKNLEQLRIDNLKRTGLVEG